MQPGNNQLAQLSASSVLIDQSFLDPPTGAGAASESREAFEEGSVTSESGGQQLSLDAFLHKHTSEDNASFEVMVAEAERRHREKHAWMYRDEGAEAAPLDAMLEGPAAKPALTGSSPTGPEAVEDDGTSKALVTWRYTNKNSLMYIPQGEWPSRCNGSVPAASKVPVFAAISGSIRTP